jgi:hypothetical protein
MTGYIKMLDIFRFTAILRRVMHDCEINLDEIREQVIPLSICLPSPAKRSGGEQGSNLSEGDGEFISQNGGGHCGLANFNKPTPLDVPPLICEKNSRHTPICAM